MMAELGDGLGGASFRRTSALIAAVFVLLSAPLAHLLWAFRHEKSAEADVVAREFRGLQDLDPLICMLGGLAVKDRAIAGDCASKTEGKTANDSPNGLDRLAAATASDHHGLDLTLLTGTWRQARSGIGSRGVSAELLRLITRVGDSSGLILDPKLESYYLISLILSTLPEMMDVLIRADEWLTASTAGDGRRLADELLRMRDVSIDQVRQALKTAGSDDSAAGRRHATAKAALAQAMGQHLDQLATVLTRLVPLLASAREAPGAASLPIIRDEWTAVARSLAADHSRLADLVGGILQERMDKIWQELYLTLALTLLLWGLSTMVGAMIMRRTWLGALQLAAARAEIDRHFTVSNDLLCVLDAAGHIIGGNPKFFEVVGPLSPEAQRRSFSDLVAPERTPGGVPEVLPEKGSTVPATYSARIGPAGAGQRLVEWVLQWDAAAGRYFGNGRDVTLARAAAAELKVAEDRLKQAAKMATLGEMASSICHEINNPLSVICGRNEQLERQLASAGPDLRKMGECVAAIGKTSARITKIVHSMRSFARNSALDQKSTFTVKDVVAETVEVCGESLARRGVSLKVDLGPDPEAKIFGHSVQISQILVNLLGNSCDAVERLPQPWIKLAANVSTDGSITIEVTDAGAGIPAAIADKVMESFFTTKPAGKGTGLGLSISAAIAQDHGGKIELDRAAPHTRFVLTLPRHDHSQAMASQGQGAKRAAA